MLNKIIKPHIKISNVYSYLKGADKTTHLVLSKRLKFTKPTTITPHTIKKKLFYRATKSFFHQKTGRFKTGLLPIIESHLKELEFEYDYVDERQVLPELYENWDQIRDDSSINNNNDNDSGEEELKPKEVDSDFFIEQNIKLHDYQVDAINFALANHRGIIKCATGGGKTLILASIIKAIGPGVKIIVIVSKRALVEQIYKALKELGINNVGRNSSDYKKKESGDIIISTVKSVHKLPEFCSQVKVLLVDEVHEFTGPLADKVFALFDNAYCRFGFSATPFKQEDNVHNHILTSIFGTLLCDVNTKELTKINILSNAIIHFYPINYPRVKGIGYQKAEKLIMVHNDYFNQSIVKLVNSISSGRIMILVKRLAHGEELSRLLPDSYWVQGNDDQETREFVIKKLRSSKPNEKVVAIFSSIGNVGLDVKIHHLINACGGKDPNMTIQKLGRGLRKANDKTHLEYHDFKFSYTVNKSLNDHSETRINTLRNEGHKILLETELLPAPPPSSHSNQKILDLLKKIKMNEKDDEDDNNEDDNNEDDEDTSCDEDDNTNNNQTK